MILGMHPAALNVLRILFICFLCADIPISRSNSMFSEMSKLLLVPPKKAAAKPPNNLLISPVSISRDFRRKFRMATCSPRNFECGANCALPWTLAGLVKAGVSVWVDMCSVSGFLLE